MKPLLAPLAAGCIGERLQQSTVAAPRFPFVLCVITLPTHHKENEHQRISPFLQLHLLVVIFAATTILGRLTSVSAPVLITWRCLIATLGAFLWVAMMRNRKIWLGKRQVGKLLGVGAIIGLHWLCLFGAVKLANVSIALAGLATLSLFTAFTEPLFDRRRIRPFEVFLGLIVLFGICLIAGVEKGCDFFRWI